MKINRRKNERTYNTGHQWGNSSKKNSRITLRNGRTIPSARYREWHSRAIKQLSEQWPDTREAINFPVMISLHFYHSDNRRRDSDNGVSSIFDTLQDAGILIDDRWQIIQIFTVRNYKAEEASCIINIIEAEND